MKTIIAIVITLSLVGCGERTYRHHETGNQRDTPAFANRINCRAKRADNQMEYCLSKGHSEGACWAAVYAMAGRPCLQ